MTTEQILSEALRLPSQVRAFVAERLIQSLDIEPGEELSQACREELRRRCKEIDEGLTQLLDGDEVIAELYRDLE